MISKSTFKLFYILFLFSTLLFAQNNYEEYHKNINEARYSKNNDSVVFFYKRAFQNANPFPKDLISLAFTYSKLEDYKKADKYFIEAVAHGYQFEIDEEVENLPYKIQYNNGFIEKYEKSNNPFSDFMKKMIKRNIKEMRKKRKKFLCKVDENQNEVFEVLLQNEYYFQYMRLNLLPTKKLKESDNNAISKYLNSGNSYLMLDLLKNEKFPKRMACSRLNEQTITMLLNHAIGGFVNKEDAKEFIDLLWKQVVQGNIAPYDYAKAYDHYVGWYIESNTTYFGTTIYKDENYENFVCMNVLYPERLDQLREKYWLPSIEEFCSATGFHLPLNYKKI